MSPSMFVITSDSLGALQAIKQFDSPHLASKNKDIVYCWVPGHVDVQGNEQVDAAVVRNLPISYRGIPFRDYFSHLCSSSWLLAMVIGHAP